MNARKSLNDLRLAASPNLGRAIKLRADDAKKILSERQRVLLAEIDTLISKSVKACHKGQSLRTKRNPAFANLSELLRIRDRILAQRDEKKSGEEMLLELDGLLGKDTN